MSNTVDIQRVFRGSVSEVTLDSLSKRGFKQVKVLNQAHVMRLIAEAVDRVLTERSQEISESEREKVIAESKAQFQTLAKQKLQEERGKIEELELINRTLQEQLEAAKGRSTASMELQAERDQANARTEALESELKGIQQQLEEMRSSVEEKAARADQLRQRLEQQEQQIQADAERLSRFEQLQAEAERAAELNALVEQRSGEVEELRRQLSSQEGVSEEKGKLESELAGLREQLDGKSGLEGEIAELKNELEAKSALEQQLSQARSGAEEAAQEIKSLQDELLEKERRVAELEGLVSARNEELEHLRGQAHGGSVLERFMETFTERMAPASTAGGEVAELKDALQGLTQKLANVSLGGGGGGGGDGGVAEVPDEASLEAFFSRADKDNVESNVENVKVRQSKAGGVTGALAKLKRMQQGGGTTDE